jgi:hypothetical protein
MAPRELGDETPEYVSFVVPVASANQPADEYDCELVSRSGPDYAVHTYKLIRNGESAFELRLSDETSFWFRVRPMSREKRLLPYVGSYSHDDFRHRLMEIEPEDIHALDELFEQERTFVIGFDPEKYAIAASLAQKAE